MRVCLLTPELPPYRVGGIGTYVAALAEELGRAGHAVEVVGADIHPEHPVVEHAWGRSRSLRAADTVLGLAGFRATESVARWLFRRAAPGAWRVYPYAAARPLAAAALAVRRFVQRHGHRYDVIEYPNWPGHAAWLPPQRGRGVYVTRLSTSAADADGGRVALAMERRAVRRARLVIANSAAMARKGQELYAYPPERGAIVPHGLPDRPAPAGPTAGAPLTLVSLGRAEDRKGTDLLVTALARVLPRYPGAAFRFVGPGLDEYLATRPDLRTAWDRLRAECPGRAENLGRVPEAEKDRLLGAAHWLVVPSRFESFGLVAVEAMRAGTPCVYAAAGGLAEVGAACAANVAATPDSADDLTRALEHVCANGPGAAVAARPAARKAFEESFSAAIMAERTLTLYRATLANSRPNSEARA